MNCTGSVSKIETMGLVDGPGIRFVVFLNSCRLRCKYCHNPETWQMGTKNYTPQMLVDKIVRYKPYFKRNNGGVTFSGGDPIVQADFLIETCKLLKKENIHIALDTAGVGVGRYQEIIDLVDLIIWDIKHAEADGYKELTGLNIEPSLEFLEVMNNNQKDVWLRQVVVPGIHDNLDYMRKLKDFVKNIKNVKRIDFLPYHKMGDTKYEQYGIENPFKDKEAMDVEKCRYLYSEFKKMI